jgi:uncharacterized protein YdeI (YjbR/CyaY-like superfamily)
LLVWLVRRKQHTGVKSMAHEDLVSEALCFGWVDSLIKRMDDDRYAIKVTPSEHSIRRVEGHHSQTHPVAAIPNRHASNRTRTMASSS